jgi:hypothetical protein
VPILEEARSVFTVFITGQMGINSHHCRLFDIWEPR